MSKPTNFGAIIEPKTSTSVERPNPFATEDDDLEKAQPKAHYPPKSANYETPNSNNPLSAFYQHPSGRTSLERAKAESRTHLPLKEFEAVGGVGHLTTPIMLVEQELEKYKSSTSQTSGMQSSAAPSILGGKGLVAVEVYQMDSAVWPSKQDLKQTAVQTKRKEMRRNWCCCMSRLNRKQRIWVRIVIALVVVAAAVGIGVGISRAVGGRVYVSNGQNNTIPDTS